MLHKKYKNNLLPFLYQNPQMDLTVMKKLKSFQDNHKIPHILFHGGTTGYEKEHIVSTFINSIYKFDRKQLKTNVLVVNCSGKGIKFIREEIKTFAKMHLSSEISTINEPYLKETANTACGLENLYRFKTVVLLNADFLTEDAQSALRRSIELFSSNTRFFMIVENKYKLLKPILSRFCEIYINNRNPVEYSQQGNDESIRLILTIHQDMKEPQKTMLLATKMYETGISSYDLARYIEKTEVEIERRIFTLFFFNKIKTEFRCEKLVLATLLDFWSLEPARSYERLKNMTITI